MTRFISHLSSGQKVKSMASAVELKEHGMKAIGFRDWNYEKALDFFDTWNENENHMGEQAALAVTCEAFGISYMDAEWVELIEPIETFEREHKITEPKFK